MRVFGKKGNTRLAFGKNTITKKRMNYNNNKMENNVKAKGLFLGKNI